MTMLGSTTALAIETAIKTRATIDPAARDALERLTGKHIVIDIPGEALSFHFAGGAATVIVAPTGVEADLSIRGSFASVIEALMSENEGNVALTGDESLIEDLRRVFKPSMNGAGADVTEQFRAMAELGVAAIRSAVQGVASELTIAGSEAKSTRTDLDAMSREVEELKATIEELKERLREAEK